MNHIRGVSGVRGIYGSSLNLNVIKKYLFSFYKTFQFKTLLLARDSRKHGQDILQFSKKFLNDLATFQIDFLDLNSTYINKS